MTDPIPRNIGSAGRGLNSKVLVDLYPAELCRTKFRGA